ncbi:hypothetical protein [Vineibacter terrae]|uniref:hypothetical protein n=1 Tax=Vineibacter terrae TaxID=2586908 RepID=UPI002E355365|nr:hypothetical protein [Vineibacter terrae]HEX2891205.1 hypothetical protein [Vineibacter terrae]
MRAALILVLALGGPVALFFLWAWASAIKRERKLRGTLPAWQDLPWTNLLIAGLLLAIVGIMAMYFTDDRKGGLLGFDPSPRGSGEREGPIAKRWEGEGYERSVPVLAAWLDQSYPSPSPAFGMGPFLCPQAGRGDDAGPPPGEG